MRAKAIAIVLTPMFLFGCGSSAETDPGVITYPDSDPAVMEQRLVEIANDELPTVSGSPDEIISLAETVCVGLDSGLGVADIVDALESAGISQYDASGFIGLSVGAKCSRHAEMFE